VLYRLTVDAPDAARLRADYHRTMVELYEENFVAVCQRWAAGRGVPFRVQGYGTPPATISSYRFADLVEGEGWGWKEITQTRWASSAAHVYGCAVISAEVWTWVHSPSFDGEVLGGGATEHGLVGPSYRLAVRGPVGDVAQVRVNGIDCGLAWAPPYRVEISDALRGGANEIEIIVHNTAANALAADEHITRLAAESEARYGRRFRMQDLDCAMESVRSGLLRVPTLVASE